MKRSILGVAALMPVLALCLTGASCNKTDSSKAIVMEKTVRTSPALKKEEAELIKKGVDQSKSITIAKVNGQEITMYSLVREMNSIAPKYVKEGREIPGNTTEQIKKAAIGRIILRELAVQEAKRQGMTVNAEEVERVIRNVKTRETSEAAYRQFLDSKGLSESEFRSAIEKSRLFEMITAKEVYSKIKINDRIVKEEYEKNRNRYMTRENPPKPLSIEEARQRIEWHIRADKGDELMAQWDQKLRKQAKVVIMLAESDRSRKKEQAKN